MKLGLETRLKLCVTISIQEQKIVWSLGEPTFGWIGISMSVWNTCWFNQSLKVCHFRQTSSKDAAVLQRSTFTAFSPSQLLTALYIKNYIRCWNSSEHLVFFDVTTHEYTFVHLTDDFIQSDEQRIKGKKKKNNAFLAFSENRTIGIVRAKFKKMKGELSE